MSKLKEQEKLDQTIEDLDENIDEMDAEDFERVVAGNSMEAFQLRRARKDVRYQLYRMQTEAEGRGAAQPPPGLREHFEGSEGFKGWKWFGITWDVALDDPMRLVKRDLSVGDEWEQIIRTKFPVIEPGGKVTYPDIKVKEKVQAEAKRQAKGKKAPTKKKG